MKSILALLIFSLMLLPMVLADVVEITIEYGNETCTESWSCTGWSDCVGGTQTRTCTDSNACDTTYDKPSESRSCTTTPPGGPGGGATPDSGVTTGETSTSTEPEVENPSEQPELKESPFVKINVFAPDQVETGDLFNANVSIESPISPIDTTVELLGEYQNVVLEAGETKNLSFNVYAPETGGEYNLVAVTPYATGNKTINLTYKPLFLYLRQTGNKIYEVNVKSFDNASTTELQVIKDGTQTVYLDILSGRIDYKVNLTFSNPGEYMIRAKAITGFAVLDEDSIVFKIGEKGGVNYSFVFLITVIAIIITGSFLLFRRI